MSTLATVYIFEVCNLMNNIIGTTIGIYTIIDICENLTKDRHKLYKGRCVYCGKEFIMKLHDFKKAKSCTHNKIKWNSVCMSSIYNKMLDRCYNENDKDYKYYGEKGIKICDEWLNNPVLFELWALDNGYKKGLTIDRINQMKDILQRIVSGQQKKNRLKIVEQQGL
jgi:hypothetical protein